VTHSAEGRAGLRSFTFPIDTVALIFVPLLVPLVSAYADYASAAEGNLPMGYTCNDVRVNVGRYGRAVALTWGRMNGATREEIAEAKNACQSRPLVHLMAIIHKVTQLGLMAQRIDGASPAEMPRFIRPQLATLKLKAPVGDQ